LYLFAADNACVMAHCVFLTDSLSFSGGRKLLLERAAYLRSLSGWDVSVLVQEPTGPLEGIVDVEVVRDFSPSSIPECDVVVATTPREVEDAWRAGRGEVVHFCQGFEITDLEQRVAGRVVPPRYSGTGLFAAARLTRKRFSWKRKIKRIDSAYRLPTVLVAVSRHLAEELALRYGREVALCENGVDLSVFHPPDDPPEWGGFSAENPLRIINVAPGKVTFKGVGTTLRAVALLKERGAPVRFIRVAPVVTAAERADSAVDEFHESVPQEKLAELLRSSHVYISNSTEGEGFGLPALEALASGVVSVLSSISSYRNFAEKEDGEKFCLFVPEGDAEATASVVENALAISPEEIRGLRRRALSVASRLSLEKSNARFAEILERVAGNRGGGGGR
jgi:hypothetical protein